MTAADVVVALAVWLVLATAGGLYLGRLFSLGGFKDDE